MSVFSVSQIFTDGCEQEWAYRYLQGLRPIRVRPEMDIGSFTHIAVAARWKEEDPISAVNIAVKERTDKVYLLPGVPEEEKSEIVDEMYTNGKIAVEVYTRWEDWFMPNEWRPLHVEERLEIDLGGGDVFWCIVDFVGVSPDGLIDCIDWKVRSEALQDPDRHQYPLQQTTYAHALSLKGVSVDRISIVQMRGQVAKTPKTNKNKTISRQMLVTTWEHYRSCVEEAGLDPNDYLEMKDKLDTIVWHSAFGTDWSPEALQSVWDAVVMPRVRRLQARRERQKSGFQDDCLRTAWGTFRCSFCTYRELCVAELLGYDFDIDEVFEVKLPVRKK